jgi:hypothetical protein
MITAKARQLPDEINDRRVAGDWDLPEAVAILTRKISTILGVLSVAMTGAVTRSSEEQSPEATPTKAAAATPDRNAAPARFGVVVRKSLWPLARAGQGTCSESYL